MFKSNEDIYAVVAEYLTKHKSDNKHYTKLLFVHTLMELRRLPEDRDNGYIIAMRQAIDLYSQINGGKTYEGLLESFKKFKPQTTPDLMVWITMVG